MPCLLNTQNLTGDSETALTKGPRSSMTSSSFKYLFLLLFYYEKERPRKNRGKQAEKGLSAETALRNGSGQAPSLPTGPSQPVAFANTGQKACGRPPWLVEQPYNIQILKPREKVPQCSSQPWSVLIHFQIKKQQLNVENKITIHWYKFKPTQCRFRMTILFKILMPIQLESSQ